MRASFVIALIYAHATGDDEMWEAAVKALAENEEQKGNDILAADIRDACQGRLHSAPAIEPTPRAVLSTTKE